MNREEIDYVQSAIGYTFKNLRLLDQAFTRKSYATENPGTLDNEVLEFYGDRVLDLYVTRMMYQEFSSLTNRGMESKMSEGELSKIRSSFVNKETLARCIQSFEFQQYLYLGKSDIINEVQKNPSVQEDLFEAILGAVAADCDWNFQKLDRVCETMLQMVTINSYLTFLVREKSHLLGFGEPIYKPAGYQQSYQDMEPYNLFNIRFSVGFGHSPKNPKTGLYEIAVKIGEQNFLGTGIGPYQALLNTDQQAYQFLCQEEIKQQFQQLDLANPVSQIHELVQKKVIPNPVYRFMEYHDGDGNPIWRCTLTSHGFSGDFMAEGSGKKEVKQQAALKFLQALAHPKDENEGGAE
ncbi:MAG: hypothetical protein IJX45_06845 [Spirochaetaceae bacterium]|nr:hypothetical protein [Spirochaetaceae bacterium]